MYDISMSPWEVRDLGDKDLVPQSVSTEQVYSDPQASACDFQPEQSGLLGAACDFQSERDDVASHDPQGAGCDFQACERSSQIQDPKGAACDLQFFMNEGGINQEGEDFDPQHHQNVTGNDTGAIPKKRTQKISRITLGMNAGKDILNETPIGINSLKRKLIWSPETPDGRSRKYSIGDNEHQKMNQDILGVIPLNDGCAIPSWNGDVNETTNDLGALILSEKDARPSLANSEQVDGMNLVVGKSEKRVLSGPKRTAKAVGRKVRARRNKNTSKSNNSDQRLITDMLDKGSGNVVDDNCKQTKKD